MPAYQSNNANQSNPKKVCIRLEEAENGWVLNGYAQSEGDTPTSGRDLEYVYDNLDKALKDVPGFVSALKEGGKPMQMMAEDSKATKVNSMPMKGGMH